MKKGAQPVKKVVVEGDDDDLANAAGGAGEDAERDARLLRLSRREDCWSEGRRLRRGARTGRS